MLRPSASTLPPFVRFLVVGGGNTALSFVLFHALLRMVGERAGGPALAQAVAYLAGATLSYALNRRWTFRDGAGGRRAVVRFAAAQGVTLAVSALLIEAMVTGARWPGTVAWVAATAVTTVMNFLLMQRWVFGTHRAHGHPAKGFPSNSSDSRAR